MPVMTPWKSTSGGPMVMPFDVRRISRIVSSWPPLRFLMSDSAFYMAPRASKKRVSSTESAR